VKRSIAVVAVALAGLGLLLAVGALAFIFMGAYNVSATVPHTSVARWLMNLTQERSVAARADDVPPPLSLDSSTLRHAFEHYQEMCVDCHGAPGIERGEIGKGINPEPPDLAEAAAAWSDRELFWIIKNGIKMAGMPAFGITHSDEELWAAVAVVRRLQDMPPEEYRRLLTEVGEHAGMRGAEGGVHAEVPGMEAHRHGEMPMIEAEAHDGMPPMEAEDHTRGQQTDHASMDHARSGPASPPADLQAPPHQGHEGVSERDPAGAAGRGAEPERSAAETAPVDADATEALKTLAAELLRDSVVLREIQADSALQRRWDKLRHVPGAADLDTRLRGGALRR
jgi:mono/diheme cytochrome c family protein